VHWGLLPPATPERRENAKLAKGRFTGDPSFEFEHTEKKDENAEEEMVSTATSYIYSNNEPI